MNYKKHNVGKTTTDHGFLDDMMKAYNDYKAYHVENLIMNNFDGYCCQLKNVPYHPLQLVQIYFDTATYDNIVKDVSVTLADQLGAIGGTMGLFAGFSFLSAMEIIYFLAKYVFAALKTRTLILCNARTS